MNQQGPVRPNKMQKTYRVDQNKGDLNKNGHNSSEIHQKGKQLGCLFRNIQQNCFKIGTKPFKICVEMAKKNELEVGNPPLKMEQI